MCERWASEGECVKNYPFMSAYCRRACLNCDADTGKEERLICSTSPAAARLLWAELGECAARRSAGQSLRASLLFHLNYNNTYFGAIWL